MIRVAVLGNESAENRKGRRMIVEMINMRRNGRTILLDSAASNAVGVRDPYNQAIYSIQKPANIYDKNTSEIVNLATAFNNVMDICGVRPGPNCDISKSQMKRILMLTDGDVDGTAISITMVCLIGKHCKPMIDAGMVGRILPPAYRIGEGKKAVYVHTQREFFDRITKKFIKDMTLRYKGQSYNDKQLNSFLMTNFDYNKKLRKLSQRYNCDPRFMEMVAWNYNGSENDQKQSHWNKVLKAYPDIQIRKEDPHLVISGSKPSTDGSGKFDFIYIPFDEYFHKRVMKFKKYQSNNSDIYNFTLNGGSSISVYDIMLKFEGYIPDDVTRYKGLGELDPDALLELCMDPKKREVYIFKFKDLESDIEKMNIIMSSKKEYMEARANIMMNEDLDDLDLDT